MTVHIHANIPKFEDLTKTLDAAQAGATKEAEGQEEVQFGSLRYIVAARGAKQGGHSNN